MAAWTLPHRIADWRNLLSTGLDSRSRKYLLGMLLNSGRRTVSSWLRAAGVGKDWQDHDYFLQTVGRSAGRVASRLVFLAVRQISGSHVGPYVKLAIDDSPTKRYGRQIDLAGTHHNPTPGPSGSMFLYGHVWVTISWLVNHPLWGCIGLPLRALMYARQKDLQVLRNIGRAPWSFRTKLVPAAELVEWCGDRPWDKLSRRPSHADRLKTLKKHLLKQSFSMLPRFQRSKRKIQALLNALMRLAS